jgi:hypothetical protein
VGGGSGGGARGAGAAVRRGGGRDDDADVAAVVATVVAADGGEDGGGVVDDPAAVGGEAQLAEGAELRGVPQAGVVVVGDGVPVAVKEVEAGVGDAKDKAGVGGHALARDNEHGDGVAVTDGVDALAELSKWLMAWRASLAGSMSGDDGLGTDEVVVVAGGAEREGGVHLDVGGVLCVVESAEGADEGVAGVAEGASAAPDGFVVAEADGGEAAELVVVDGVVVVCRLCWRPDWRVTALAEAGAGGALAGATRMQELERGMGILF